MAGDVSSSKKAEEAGTLGTIAFRISDYEGAAKYFQQAVKLEPENSELITKLARTELHQGVYNKALSHYLKAVQLDLATGNKRAAVLCVGALQVAILGRDTNHSNEIYGFLSQLPRQNIVLQKLRHILDEQMERMLGGNNDKIQKHWQQILDHLPRCRPTLFVPLSLYQATSTEVATSIMTKAFWESAGRESTQIAFLLGGYVDARHLFKTLIEIKIMEDNGAPKHRYHFTMVEALPHYAARLAVFCYLMMTPSDENDTKLRLLVIAMAFLTSRMPRFVYDRLIGDMKVVRESLLRDSTVPHCPFLWIPKSCIPGIVNCLECWCEEKPFQQNLLPFQFYKNTEPFAGDKKVWEAARVVRIHNAVLDIYNPDLGKAINEYEDEGYGDPAKTDAFKELIHKTWIVNPFSWDATVSATLNQLIPDDPSSTAVKLAPNYPTDLPRGETQVLLLLSAFFTVVAEALQTLQHRLIIETLTGDLDETCERMCIRYLPDRASGAVAGRPDLDAIQFPWMYDHIFCNTTPAYTGCMLPMMRHCLPLLKHAGRSILSATFVSAPSDPDPIPLLVAEFAALNSPELLYTMAGAVGGHSCQTNTLSNTLPTHKEDETLQRFVWWRMRNVPDYLPKSTETSVGQSEPPVPFSKLAISKNQHFERWIMTLFWRIAAPLVQCGGEDLLHGGIKCMPENMSSFVRILDFAHRHAGFPGHWINGLVSKILSGRTDILVSIPRGQHMTPTEAIGTATIGVNACTYSPTGTAYWAAELSTMLSIWRPVLSWGIGLMDFPGLLTISPAPTTESKQPAGADMRAGCPVDMQLPPLSGIYRYSAIIRGIDPREILAAPQHTLLLWDAGRLGYLPKPLGLLDLALGTGQESSNSDNDDDGRRQVEKREKSEHSEKDVDEKEEQGERKDKGKGKRKRKRVNRKKKMRQKAKEKLKTDNNGSKVEYQNVPEENDGGSGSESEGVSLDESDIEGYDQGGHQGEGGSGGGAPLTAVDSPVSSYDKAVGALHMISAFEWKWLDIEERSGVATWWMRADVMNAILHNTDTDTCWQLWLCSTSSWQCIKHDAVPVKQIETHGSWETLLTGSCDGDPLPRGNPNRYYHAAPVVKLPTYPHYPTRGSLWQCSNDVQVQRLIKKLAMDIN